MTATIINGVTYYQCGSAWYQPAYQGTQVTYIVVHAPAGQASTSGGTSAASPPTGQASVVVGTSLSADAFGAKCSLTPIVINGQNYYKCESTWYQSTYRGSQVTYIVVNPPQ